MMSSQPEPTPARATGDIPVIFGKGEPDTKLRRALWHMLSNGTHPAG